MSWNYRIMAHEHENEMYFEIHEVYYDKDGKPESCTKNPVTVGSEDDNGISWILDKMKESLEKPILWYGDKFTEEYK